MRKGLIAIATAASIAAGVGIATPASAQYYGGGDHRYDHRGDRHDHYRGDWRRHDRWHEDRRWRRHRHDRYGYGYENQPVYGGYYGW